MFKKFKILFASLILITSVSANADLAIIVHPDYNGANLMKTCSGNYSSANNFHFPAATKPHQQTTQRVVQIGSISLNTC